MRLPLVTLIFLVFSASAEAQRVSRGPETPDFLQTDREGGFAGSGTQFCAPTAVSNSLMYLAANGYDELSSGRGKRAQIAMIRKLAGRNFMNTSPSAGTDAAQLIAGVEAYVTDAGYSISELSYEGWRRVPADAAAGEHPDLDDIRNYAVGDGSTVWLNVGWYRYDEESGDYARKGGHWVTVVGYDGDELLIHDPSPAAGSSPRTQRVRLEELTEGQLTGNQPNLPRDASGYYELGGQMAIGKGWSCILDGAVFLTLE